MINRSNENKIQYLTSIGLGICLVGEFKFELGWLVGGLDIFILFFKYERLFRRVCEEDKCGA